MVSYVKGRGQSQLRRNHPTYTIDKQETKVLQTEVASHINNFNT